MTVARLADLCVRSISTFKAVTWQDTSFLYLDVSSIDVSAKAITNPKRVNVAEAPSRAQTVVSAGDILVSNVRPNLNAVARVTPEFDGAVCSSAFTVLRCGIDLDPDYLFCLVQSPGFIEKLSSLAQGAHYPAVADRQVLATEIDLLPLEKQSAIARKLLEGLRASPSAVAACAEQNELSATFWKRTLIECFHDKAPISADMILPKVSSGKRWYRLLDLARLESGHTPSRRHLEWWGGKIHWLALPDIRRLHGKFAYETTENTNDAGIANSSARMLPVGTVCVSRTASIGFVTILGKPMSSSQDFCNWICDRDKLDPEFLMYAFMASQDALVELGSGAVHKTIYMPTIKSFHICAPEITEQRRIARTLRERLAAADSLAGGLKARLVDIERLPQCLLASAFGQA
jgi:type I restriction enzyme, S subunit